MTIKTTFASPNITHSKRGVTKLTDRTPFSSHTLMHAARVVNKVEVHDSMLKL